MVINNDRYLERAGIGETGYIMNTLWAFLNSSSLHNTKQLS